jgi:hypothetical protein
MLEATVARLRRSKASPPGKSLGDAHGFAHGCHLCGHATAKVRDVGPGTVVELLQVELYAVGRHRCDREAQLFGQLLAVADLGKQP